MDRLQVFADRGYVVKETGPVYFTPDMNATVKWFEDVLGWYYEIDERNAEGNGVYGCVYNIPKEIEILHIAPFTGIHLFHGEPKGGLVAFIHVDVIEKLYRYVKSKGYQEISEIQTQPWGGKICTLKTPDGYSLQFFK